LSQSASDFSDPVLAGIYQEWAKSKQAGVSKILSIAKEEGYTQEQLKKMEILIKEYFEYFNITF
jgi:anti-sigma regulatory factor (Ser/Thr protein kinase)